MGTILLWFASTAFAWTCTSVSPCGCVGAAGSSATYRMHASEFTSAGRQEIEDAADAWDAGSGKRNRGAEFDFVRGADTTGDGSNFDGTNNVRKKPDSWFDDRDYPESALAVAEQSLIACVMSDTDITFRESETFTTAIPSENTGSNPSIGQTAEHEFGHFLGLDHENDVIAIMNEFDPFGGDIARKRYRIGEDDYDGLRALKSAPISGFNFMLSRFEPNADPKYDTSLSKGHSRERWAVASYEPSSRWRAEAGTTLDVDDGPGGIFLHYLTAGSSIQTTIEWRISPYEDCFDVMSYYVVGTRSPTVSSNTPYFIDGPAGGYSIPSNATPGLYYLCAKVDPDDQQSESSETDNILNSEKKFEVE